MTERQCRRLLREDILPVILGNSLAAHRLAFRLSLRYGLSPILFAPHRRALDLLDPFGRVLPSETEDARLACEQLCDLAERYEGVTLYLIPATPREQTWLGAHTEALEGAFRLTDPQELSRQFSPLSR